MTPLAIAIIGAGPAGLASALYLKRAGHRPHIFEQFDRPAPVGSGLILQPTGLSVLADLGLLDTIMSLGNRIDRLYGEESGTGRVVLDVRYAALNKHRFGLGVHRNALFSVLHDAVQAGGIPVETNREIISLERLAGGLALSGKNAIAQGAFDLVVDCSGARSELRRYSDDPRAAAELDFGALWASLEHVPIGLDDRALVQRYNKASIMIGVLPMGRPDRQGTQKSAFFWSIKPRDMEQVRADGLSMWKQTVMAHWPQVLPYLDQIHDFDQFTLARYGHQTMRQPFAERLAFVGDSAHCTSPQLGQGANMALLDARALAEALSNSPDIGSALKNYAVMRRSHVRFFQLLSLAFTPFYQSDSALLPWIRDRVVSPLSRISPAQKLLASMVSGTLVSPFQSIGLSEVNWAAASPK